VKVAKIYSLPPGTVDAIAKRAAAVGVSQSALADLYLRGGLATVPEDKLQAWARAQRTERAAAVTNRPKGSESRALEVLTAEWQPFSATRAVAGQGDTIHWRALKGLEARGLAEQKALDHAVHVDPRTKRPVTSHWRKAAP
jgi:hypothetical protein